MPYPQEGNRERDELHLNYPAFPACWVPVCYLEDPELLRWKNRLMGHTPKTTHTLWYSPSFQFETVHARTVECVPLRSQSAVVSRSLLFGCLVTGRTIPEVCTSNSLPVVGHGFYSAQDAGPFHTFLIPHPFHFSLPPTEFCAVSSLAPNVAFRAAKSEGPLFSPCRTSFWHSVVVLSSFSLPCRALAFMLCSPPKAGKNRPLGPSLVITRQAGGGGGGYLQPDFQSSVVAALWLP